MEKPNIIDLKASKRKNLKNKSSRKRTETNLQRKIESLLFRESKGAIGLREVEIHGYGIADLVIFKSICGESDEYNINAFEIKIKNWKKALQQAYRYRYYANQAVVIMPVENVPKDCSRISLFELMDVGLWSYDSRTNHIQKIFTPTNNTPKNDTASIKALNFIKDEINFCEINK